ncbi:ubiquitin thioesterase OTU1-like [Limulus polyphemus]|uniref:Ubiquitin thioesterase OTU n=1 Tax=Limulus polyphemus TaxID=6850 RepID=A0ABM1T5P3_LIMPO|nr:ubiquitin thioesterase OTU1-like [Limulus polyphemus]XP_022251198.1 ubiquitin thioesterase OTU1-like [Limulus polyphemus]XP_022251199.1 ubiquitin thioesterase OTU1-like [Limulus polyphemus]
MASSLIILQCKSRNGQSRLNHLTREHTVADLIESIAQVTGCNPLCIKILAGFPPKPLDISDRCRNLENLPIKSGDTLIIQEETSQRKENLPKDEEKQLGRKPQGKVNLPNLQNPSGILIRRVVPANNSCLFTSVYFAISGGVYDTKVGDMLRKVIADTVSADKETYCEAFLGKSNKDYCKWILNNNSWGGAIELSILSKYYKVEIVAVDTQNVRLNRFGEDAKYENRIFLIYDGIHYDPLMLEPLDHSHSVQTIFPKTDECVLQMAMEIAQEAKSSRQFTDIQNFSLRCLVCSQCLKGQQEAQQHAKDTGHCNFGEI